jgi:hypothetical protein
MTLSLHQPLQVVSVVQRSRRKKKIDVDHGTVEMCDWKRRQV